jgi:hypothetical protein
MAAMPELANDTPELEIPGLAVNQESAPDPTLMDVMQMLHKHDQMLTWVCNTMNWMTGIFNGLQAAASMMPGRAGKMAKDIMGGQNNGG